MMELQYQYLLFQSSLVAIISKRLPFCFGGKINQSICITFSLTLLFYSF